MGFTIFSSDVMRLTTKVSAISACANARCNTEGSNFTPTLDLRDAP